MPRSNPCFPRQRLPAPITTATSTPISCTSLIRLAIDSASSTSMPKPDLAASASPLSLSRIRLYLISLILLLCPSLPSPFSWENGEGVHEDRWGHKKTNPKVGLHVSVNCPDSRPTPSAGSGARSHSHR